MGRLSIRIDDELDKALRLYIVNNGGKQGDLRQTIEDMISNFLNSPIVPIKTQQIKSDFYTYIPNDDLIKKEKELVLLPENIKDLNERFEEYYSLMLEDIKNKRNTKVDVNKVNAIQNQYEPERVPSTIFEDEEERNDYGYNG